MSRSRSILLATCAVCLSLILCLVMLEILLRFLPVTTGMSTQAVTPAQPVARFAPNEKFTWSDEWNFAIVNHGRINNDGFVNDQDYDATDTRPLLAIIGDSYVEASMVPYEKTLHGRLAAAAAPDARVYSLAASGAPLSQYLIWARYARETYKPASMAFVIIGNDFDESLPAYVMHQAFHQFVPDDNGTLNPALLKGFQPSWKRTVVKSSALARYVFFNLNVWLAWDNIRQTWMRRKGDEKNYVANTDASMDDTRLADSKQVVDAFFRLLPEYSGLKPRNIAFVVDSSRGWIYRNDPAMKKNNYFDAMRSYFMDEALKRGYGVVDMDWPFEKDFRAHGQKFEFPTDGHWNDRGHGLAADALMQTHVYKTLFR